MYFLKSLSNHLLIIGGRRLIVAERATLGEKRVELQKHIPQASARMEPKRSGEENVGKRAVKKSPDNIGVASDEDRIGSKRCPSYTPQSSRALHHHPVA